MNKHIGERFVVVADSHGSEIDEVAEKAVLNFLKDYKPTIRLHLGDAFDFSSLRQGASNEDKAESLELDWQMGEEFIQKYFEGGKKNIMLLGNHDDRIYQLRKNSIGVNRDYAEDGVKRLNKLFDKCEAEVLPYDSRLGVYKLGKLKAVHGYYVGRNAVEKHASIYGDCLLGHVHSIQSCPIERYGEEGESRSIGCLCNVDQDYNKRMPSHLRHRNGFAYGTLFNNGSYQLFQSSRIDNNFYAAMNIKQY